jgi:WD40 repeat protein
MKRRIERKTTIFALLLAALLLALPLSLHAQGAPEQIEDALADLSERVGQPLTLNDLFWRWEQRTYEDTSLGCPQPGETYVQQQIVGYRFLFTWDDNIYEYRISADREILIFCGMTPVDDEDDAAPEPEDDTPRYSNPLCGMPPEDIHYMHTRLAVDMQARIAPGLPSSLRAEPESDAALMAEITPGNIFTVIAGPRCDEAGALWWQIDLDGTIGWTAEGRNGDYFIEPLPGLALPAQRTAITAENAATLVELSRLEGNLGPALAISPVDSRGGMRLVVPGDRGSEGVWIYDLTLPDLIPTIITDDSRLTSVAFGAEPVIALFGGAEGSIRLWDVRPDAPLVERAFLTGHNTAVSAVAFRSDGAKMASSGGLALAREQQDDNLYAILIWDVATVSQSGALRGHSGDVTALEFSADGQMLASASLDSTLRLWDLETRAAETIVEAPAPALDLALSPDGSRIALALENGDVVLVDAAGNIEATLAVHTAAVNSVAFSPDGALLVSGGDDGALLVWDLADLTAEPVALSGHTGPVMAAAFSPDGTLIASVSADRSARLWGAVQTAG